MQCQRAATGTGRVEEWRKQSQSATEGKTICYNGFRLNFSRRAGENKPNPVVLIWYYHGKKDHHKRATTERPHPTGGAPLPAGVGPPPGRTGKGEVDSDSLFRVFRWIPWLISDRLAEVIPGSLEESHVHRLANSWKTSSAGYAFIWPASKAASRFSASLAQSSSIARRADRGLQGVIRPGRRPRPPEGRGLFRESAS